MRASTAQTLSSARSPIQISPSATATELGPRLGRPGRVAGAVGNPPTALTLPVAGIICFAAGFLFGQPALRLSGVYLALATFALATAMPQLLKLGYFEQWTGGVQGLVVTKPDAPEIIESALKAMQSVIDPQEFLAKEAPCGGSEIFRAVTEFLEAHLLHEQPADLCFIAVKRGNHDVRWPVTAQLHDQVGRAQHGHHALHGFGGER